MRHIVIELEERVKELETEIRKVLAKDDEIISYDSADLYGLRELMEGK